MHVVRSTTLLESLHGSAWALHIDVAPGAIPAPRLLPESPKAKGRVARLDYPSAARRRRWDYGRAAVVLFACAHRLTARLGMNGLSMCRAAGGSETRVEAES